MKQSLLLIFCAFLGAVFALSLERYFFQPPAQEVVVREVAPARYTNYDEMLSNVSARTLASDAPNNFIAAAESVTDAVVHIKAESNSGFDFWSGRGVGSSSGSGVIISPDGYIITNSHVIEAGDEVSVTLNDRNELEATVIGTDPSTDLALIKVEGRRLPHLQIGNSDSLRIGEWVLAVGSPFNLHSTVTAGIVSAKGRNINILEGQNAIESFIQTDAMVNPGNSGGALVNTRGQLIGINTAIMTRSGHFEGYSFAIPANLAFKVINDIRNFGAVQRGILGVDINELDSKHAKRLGLASVEGVYIEGVHEGSGAAAAGLKRGDVIMAVNGKKVITMPELQEQIARLRPKDNVNITYIRKGKQKTTDIILKSNEIAPVQKSSAEQEENIFSELGFELRSLHSAETARLGVEGVKVLSITRESRIASTNMELGFILLQINGNPVASVEEAMLMLELSEGEITLEGIYEDYTGEYIYKFEKE